MLSLLELLKESYSKKIQLNEGGASGHMIHLFEDGSMTFGDLKEIFKQLFSGEIEISEKTDGQALAVTYKDGEIKAARNKKTLKNPMSISELEEKYDGRGEIKNAFVNSMKDISNAIKTLSEKEIKSIFNDGHNYMAFEIIYPPTKNVIYYGNRCLIQLHGVNIYDENFNKISEDKSIAKKLYNLLKKHNALNQEKFEISNDAKLKIKNSKTARESLDDILNKLEKIQGNNSDETTLSEYINNKYKDIIIDYAKKSNIDISNADELIENLAKKMSNLNTTSLSINEIKKMAISNGIDANSEEYKKFISSLKDTKDVVNQKLIFPIESLIVYTGMQLMENLIGYVSADRNESSKELVKYLEEQIKFLKKNKNNLSPNALKTMNKNLEKLKNFGKTSTGVEGIVFLYKGRVYKMTGNFGVINQLLGIIKYDR